MTTNWYRYRQNNSGGGFDGPAITVWIEACTDVQANELAEENGLYFDGVEAGRDCDCCGDRWTRADTPDTIGDMAKDIKGKHGSGRWDPPDIPTFKVIYLDGRQA